MTSVITKIKIFINNNGKYKLLQSDNGKEFDNREMHIFCENEDIKYIKSAPYHPQTNGAEEIIHKTEQHFLEKRKNILKNNFVLELELDIFILFYNNKKHTSAGYTPNELKDIDDPLLIEDIQNNIVKSLQIKLKNNQNNIQEGCFILLSANFYIKNDVYYPNNKKSTEKFIIPGIFKKFINS